LDLILCLKKFIEGGVMRKQVCLGRSVRVLYPRKGWISGLALIGTLALAQAAHGEPTGTQVSTLRPTVPGVEASTTIQAAPIEVNASAPKPDPDPYALPPNAPESLVKLRKDIEKFSTDYQKLTAILLQGLESKNFDKLDTGETHVELVKGAPTGAPSVNPAGLSSVRTPLQGELTQDELIKNLETVTGLIEMSQAEFLQEKEVFLTHGQVQFNPNMVNSIGHNVSQVQGSLGVKK